MVKTLRTLFYKICRAKVFGFAAGRKVVKIMVFLHGTVIMHSNALGHTREERVLQVVNRDSSINDYASYVPIGNAVRKLRLWRQQGVEIIYLSFHKSATDVWKDLAILKRYRFPEGLILFRNGNEDYKDVAEKEMPDILIEDNCESIGGEMEMTYPHIRLELRKKIKSIVVEEFGGIDHLPDNLSDLVRYKG